LGRWAVSFKAGRGEEKIGGQAARMSQKQEDNANLPLQSREVRRKKKKKRRGRGVPSA